MNIIKNEYKLHTDIHFFQFQGNKTGPIPIKQAFGGFHCLDNKG
jgi:hypothetical protein